MRDAWFDNSGLDLLDTSSARESETFKKYMEDDYISSGEMDAQATKLRGMMTAQEGTLDDATHASMGAIFHQYDVLIEMYKASLAMLSKEAGEDAPEGAEGPS